MFVTGLVARHLTWLGWQARANSLDFWLILKFTSVGFDYNFSAIQHEENELFLAYKDMFEIAVSSGTSLWDIFIIYAPWLERIFVRH